MGNITVQQSKISLLIKPLTSLLAADFFPLIFAVGFSIVLGRVMREEALGVYSIATTIAILLRMFAEAGYEVEIPRDIASGKGLGSILEAQYVKNIILTILLPIGIIYSFISVPKPEPLILFLWNYPFAFAFSLRAALRGLDKSKSIAIIESISAFFQYGLLILSIFLFSSISIIFILMVIFEVMRAFVYYRYLNHAGYFKDISFIKLFWGNSQIPIRDFFKTILQKRRALFALNIFSSLQNRMAFLTMGVYSTPYEAGIYSAASRFPGFMRILPGAILNSIVPLYSSGKHPRFRFTFSLSLFLAVISGLFLYFGADFLIRLFYDFPESSHLLMIMSAGFAFSVLHQTVEGFMLAHGLESKVNQALFFTMILTLLTSIAFYPSMGLKGFATAYTLGEMILLIAYLLILYLWNGRRRKVRE